MPNKLTIAYIIVIISVLIAIVIVVAPMSKTSEQTIEPTASTTPTMATSTIPTDPLAGIDLTFPEATQEIEGMVRVEDNISELHVQEYPTHTEENSGFVLKHLEQTVTEEACTKHHLSNTEGYRCYEASPELFNELIVLSKDTGEVLHKYKLNKGYSLINNKYAIEGGGVFIEEIGSEEYTIIGIYIFKWDDFSTPTSGGNNGQTEYYFNLETGEITRE